MFSRGKHADIAGFEWQTFALIIISYASWVALLINGSNLPPLVWCLASAINLTFFMSVTHEVVHGHPTRHDLINRLLIFLPIGWSVPYERFRDTHIAHHDTSELTDPFDDPETWYLTQSDWLGRSHITKQLLRFNNTLFGRMLVGPVIGLGSFYRKEVELFTKEPNLRTYLSTAWALHFALCAIMALIILRFGSVPLWQWAVAIYLGHSILLIRTFLEHQSAPDHNQRTVIIEKACPIAFLFLFNNYHFVHHDRPHVPWYKLPSCYAAYRQEFLAKNGAYVYESYMTIFRKFMFTAKEPVPHPLLRVEDAN